MPKDDTKPSAASETAITVSNQTELKKLASKLPTNSGVLNLVLYRVRLIISHLALMEGKFTDHIICDGGQTREEWARGGDYEGPPKVRICACRFAPLLSAVMSH
jgi:hypothetical protein